jgi:Tfp pilus assembly protein PilX
MEVNLSHAKRRGQRGAAIFVVVMVLTMLTAVGIFAMRASSLSSAASGYQRQATGSQAYNEYGIVATVGELGTDRRGEYVKRAIKGEDHCLAAQGMYSDAGATVPCFTIYDKDLGENGIADLNQATGDAGTSTMEGEFHVEITDVGPAAMPVAGGQIGSSQGGKYLQVTLTSFGQARPAGQTGEAAAISAGNSMGRAHVVVGPVK